ncbi:hypothetical protein [Streptomyces sp. ID01-9D]|uniref:hypothetical protein n=1 Tax=Streptomyces sp. ID01-9D TaxID=3028659 RepID=UPI0029C9D424|nr:hypothetical protein [Streptomyces sp. ID01-9D]
MSQPWQPQPPQHNPYGQPAPQQQPGYGYPAAPYPPQQPMQHGYPSPYAPGFPSSGGPRAGKAFFLGLLVSGALGLVYSGILLATHKDLSRVGLQASYLVLAAALAVGVGAVVGRTGGRGAGPQVWAAILAAPAAYFGVANGYVFTLLDAGGVDLLELVLENEPLAPHKFWWHRLNGGVALVGLVVAAGGAFAVANVIGRKQQPQQY